MCGIIGIVNSANKALISNNLHRIKHRGPDADGICVLENIVFGHTRLAIQDTSELGAQPMISSCGRFVIVFNGEIYNTAALIHQEKTIAESKVGTSDTSVILEFLSAKILRNENFETTLRKINGIFSFALYDKIQKKCWLVRDHLGIKPLFYNFESNVLNFCSEMGGLLSISQSAKNLNETAVSRYLCFLWKPGVDELVQGIKSVPGGSYLELTVGKYPVVRGWYELPLNAKPKKTSVSAPNLAKAVSETLKQVVETQMVADVPIGCFLSGGLDSSAICYFAKQAHENLSFYTIDQGNDLDDQVNDLPYAEKFAKFLGVDLNVISIGRNDFIRNLEEMIIHLGEPIADPAAMSTYFICKEARQQEVKVMLSGTGGDDVFSGYRRHIVARYGYLLDLIGKPIQLASAIAPIFKRENRRLEKLLSGLSRPRSERLIHNYLWTDTDFAISLLSAEVRSGIDKANILYPMKEFLDKVPFGRSDLQKSLLLDQKFFMTNHNLVYTDRMSMATGVEVRVPFLDPLILELGSKIPDKFLQRGMTGKWILKEAMKPYLPEQIINRPKTGFGLPIRTWMKVSLPEIRETYLSEASISQNGIFDFNQIFNLMQHIENGDDKHSYTLLSVLCMQIWYTNLIKN